MYYQKRTYAMGTSIEIILDAPGEQEWLRDIASCFEIFSRFEDEFSRFQQESLLTRVNQRRQDRVSENYREVFRLCQKMYEYTQGYFNPCIDVSWLWYSQSFELLDKRQTQEVWIHPEWSKLFEQIGLNDAGKIELPDGVALDFGGIVKGFCVDGVANYLLKKDYKNFLINAWGDIWVQQEDATPNTQIEIENPYQAGQNIATLEMRTGSLCTSWVYKRNWLTQDMMYHHIITPQTGNNNYDIQSVSLLTDSAGSGDALATALIAMWSHRAQEFIERHSIDAIVFFATGEIYLSPSFQLWNYNFTLLS